VEFAQRPAQQFMDGRLQPHQFRRLIQLLLRDGKGVQFFGHNGFLLQDW